MISDVVEPMIRENRLPGHESKPNGGDFTSSRTFTWRNFPTLRTMR